MKNYLETVDKTIADVKADIEELRLDRADLELHINEMERELDAINDHMDERQHVLADLENDRQEYLASLPPAHCQSEADAEAEEFDWIDDTEVDEDE